MHSNGVIGLQFLHSASSDSKVSRRTRSFSVFQIGCKTGIIFYFSSAVWAVDGEGGGNHPLLPEKTLFFLI
jgi:hypothetical protein